MVLLGGGGLKDRRFTVTCLYNGLDCGSLVGFPTRVI